MGFDIHMIAGSRAALHSARPTQSNITNQTSPHYGEALDESRRANPIRSAEPLHSVTLEAVETAAWSCQPSQLHQPAHATS
jgi:hypothetical protein